jgi:LysM repeat protein
MYDFYMGKVLLPISPSKMQTVINNQNKTVNLMNEGEVNFVKAPGLTVYKFDIILPLYTNYPFARYKSGIFQPAGYYLSYFEKLKVNGTTFEFIVNRFKYDPSTKAKQNIMKTNMRVVLENYTVIESADNAPDIEVSIELKEYIKYGTIVKEIDTKTNTVKNSVVKKEANKSIPNTYTIKKGDTLWAIAKKLLGDGAKCWNLAKLNNISNPNRIRPGQVLKIQDVKATTAPASATLSTKSTVAKSTPSKSRTTVKTVTPSAAKANAMLKNPFLISYEPSPLTYEGTLEKIMEVRRKKQKGLIQTEKYRR